MPYGEDCSRNRCKRILGKVRCCKACRESRVLHTHFDGNGTTLCGVQLQGLCCKVAREIAQYIMADYHTDNQKTVLHDPLGIHGNYRRNNKNNCGCGNQGKGFYRFLRYLTKETIDHNTENNRHKNHFYNGNKHPDHLYIDSFSGIEQRKKRRHKRSQNSGNGSHTN